eukprot:CAMPEP_0119483556 /NCGR_PEP_ID=MMETSP1344-20130328/10912_1 /TAXON_ID=236787 /ORGANISM="Florenciella parvula, Strain CCMP2471" /LENGTH=361 /DNA_ID=CAMNT_0007518061 /DNA_START=89 /DNA_END=1174 /DNA_ORIENTATION=+
MALPRNIALALALAFAAGGDAISTVYREPHYEVTITENVSYATTLVDCTDQHDPSTCVETEVYLDVYQPANVTEGDAAWGHMPVVVSVHGGGFTSGDKTMEPKSDYFAERGFVGFSVDYRLSTDKGLYPDDISWWPGLTSPAASWQAPLQNMYPAVRDIRAALRWVHANAAAYGGDATSSLTIQGGSAGATAVMELAITGGGDASTWAGDYTSELEGVDPTLNSTNLDQAPTVTGLIDYWGALFTEDAMSHGDKHPNDVFTPRWSADSPPAIAFHGTEDTTVSPESGDVLVGNLTALGVDALKVDLPGQAHGCWSATVTLDDGTVQTIYDYAFDWMAEACDWPVATEGHSIHGPLLEDKEY